jgi:hypothetical protein
MMSAFIIEEAMTDHRRQTNATMRHSGLYRPEADAFDASCAKRWDTSRRRA